MLSRHGMNESSMPDMKGFPMPKLIVGNITWKTQLAKVTIMNKIWPLYVTLLGRD